MTPTLFLSCFAVYIIAITLFGAWVSRKQQSGDEFLLGGRSLPFFLTLGTTVATIVGTGSSMGSVGKAYSAGWAGSFFGIGTFIGILLTAVIFGSVRKFNFMTMAEELSSYVGGNRIVSGLVAVFTYMACVGWLGAHILGGGFYLQYVTEIDKNMALVLIALGFSVYSMIGGYRAVVWTDTIQAIVLFIGFSITAIFAYQSIGGMDGLKETHETLSSIQETESGASWLRDISLVIAMVASILATPSFRQRIYSGNSVGEIKKAFFCSAILALFFCLLPSIVGMAAYNQNPGLERSDLAFPYMAMEVLPLTLGIVTLLAGLSATMSSASSDAIAGVTVFVRDIYEMAFGRVPDAKNVVLLSRIGLAVTAGLALLMAMAADNIIDYIKAMVSLFISGMAVCAVMGRLWPRYNSSGAIASLVSAFLTALILLGQEDWASMFGGSVIPVLVISILFGAVVSLLTPPDELTQSEMVEILNKRREQMSPAAKDG